MLHRHHKNDSCIKMGSDESHLKKNQYFMFVHIEVILDQKKHHAQKYEFSHRTMKNWFDNISDNISSIQNISYIVVSI